MADEVEWKIEQEATEAGVLKLVFRDGAGNAKSRWADQEQTADLELLRQGGKEIFTSEEVETLTSVPDYRALGSS